MLQLTKRSEYGLAALLRLAEAIDFKTCSKTILKAFRKLKILEKSILKSAWNT